MPQLRSNTDRARLDASSILAVVFLDVIESVRLQQADPAGFARRWSAVVRTTATVLCPRHDAQFAKSLGDGMMLTAKTGQDAVRLAQAVLATVELENANGDPARMIQIRGGIDIGPLLVTDRDIYGHAANIAARLAGLGRAGQFVVSDAIRLTLPPEHDDSLVDLGECHLRNVEGTVRAHALGRSLPVPPRPMLIPETALRPVIAIIPPTDEAGAANGTERGDAFADEVIAELSRVSALSVISRLSTRRLIGLSGDVAANSRDLLTADYVVSGRARRSGGRTSLDLEFSDARRGTVIWTEAISASDADLFDGQREAARGIAERVVQSVLRSELETSRSASMPTLANYTLLLSGITSMYSLGRSEFDRARSLLDALADRASRQATPLVWLAKWHVLKIVQGWSGDRTGDAAAARNLVARALDADPQNAFALTVEGLIQTNLERRFDLGETSFAAALALNPSEPLAWLIRGALYSFTDRGEEAVRNTSRAHALSPLDPHRFYKLALAAGAHLTAGLDAEALALAQASLQANRLHLSTLRILAVAQWRLGQADAARGTVQRLLALAPDFTVTKYRETAPSADYRIGRDVAQVLHDAGVPA